MIIFASNQCPLDRVSKKTTVERNINQIVRNERWSACLKFEALCIQMEKQGALLAIDTHFRGFCLGCPNISYPGQYSIQAVTKVQLVWPFGEEYCSFLSLERLEIYVEIFKWDILSQKYGLAARRRQPPHLNCIYMERKKDKMTFKSAKVSYYEY